MLSMKSVTLWNDIPLWQPKSPIKIYLANPHICIIQIFISLAQLTAAIIQGYVVWPGNSWTGCNMMLLYEKISVNSRFRRIVQVHQVVFQTTQNCYKNTKDVISCLWKGNNEQNSKTWLAFHIKKRRQYKDKTASVTIKKNYDIWLTGSVSNQFTYSKQ
jgi:hypothetical protein